jgi:rhodanese-related sulfurtransferase
MDPISPKDAQALMDQGWVYIDVRGEAEYEGGHPAGSLNVPLMVMDGGRRMQNPDFLPAIEALFEKDSKLILGCAGGGRAARAGAILESAGFKGLRECAAGWFGIRDGDGMVTEPGWPDANLPVENGQPEDRSWQALLKRMQG